MADLDRRLTPDEAAAYLRVSRSKLRRLEIPRIVLGHKTVRYRLSDIQAFEKKAEAA